MVGIYVHYGIHIGTVNDSKTEMKYTINLLLNFN